jgi:hypothetical protein
MTLKNLLLQKKASILERWFDLILETYPAGASKSLKREKDRFVNPVGQTISREIRALYDGLVQGISTDQLSSSLNNIIRIRSVQDFPPSQAIGFIFLLKKAIREVLESGIQEKQVLEEWLEFQSRIDQLTLLAFDIYMECREKICEIRVNEAKAAREMAFRLVERMNVMKEKSGKGEGVNS